MSDIEILEKLVIYWNSLINYAEKDKKGVVYKWINTEGVVEQRDALLNLINRIKELEDTLKCTQDSWYEDTKKIEELKNRVKELEHLLTTQLGFNLYRDYIPKSKIKEKIEPKLKELEKEIKQEWKKYGNSKELQDMEDMYNFLQELLEEQEK